MKKISTILSPLFLGVFLLPLFASAEVASTTSDDSNSSSTVTITLTKAQLFTGCSQDAIELRDNSLAQSRTTYNNAMNALLIERKNAEKAAVAIEDEADKKAAIKDSVEVYKSKVKTIQNALTQSRKTIWQTFENDTKKCRTFLDKDEETISKEDKQSVKDIAKKELIETKELKKEEVAPKTVKESIFDSIKSLFSKE